MRMYRTWIAACSNDTPHFESQLSPPPLPPVYGSSGQVWIMYWGSVWLRGWLKVALLLMTANKRPGWHFQRKEGGEAQGDRWRQSPLCPLLTVCEMYCGFILVNIKQQLNLIKHYPQVLQLFCLCVYSTASHFGYFIHTYTQFYCFCQLKWFLRISLR